MPWRRLVPHCQSVVGRAEKLGPSAGQSYSGSCILAVMTLDAVRVKHRLNDGFVVEANRPAPGWRFERLRLSVKRDGSKFQVWCYRIARGMAADATLNFAGHQVRVASDLLLRPHEEIIKLHQSQIHPPITEKDSKSIFAEHIEKITQGQKHPPVEHVALRSDGVEVPVEIMSQIVHIGGRQVVQGVFRDVTERKKAEIELKNSHERFRTVLDSLDALIYVSNMDTHEILFTNKSGRNIWGDITGKTCWKTLQTGQNGPCDFCTNDRLLDGNGESTGIHRWEFQNMMDHQWYDCHDQAIPWTDGRLVRMEVAANITDRKQAEAALQRHTELLDAIRHA